MPSLLRLVPTQAASRADRAETPIRSRQRSVTGKVARLLLEDESVVEVDCNPVLVSAGRLLVADALVVRR